MPPLALTSAQSSNSATVSWRKRTPAFSSRPIAAAKAAATVWSSRSSGTPCAMPNRRPATATGSSGTKSVPAMMASVLAQSMTVRASGPIESSVVLNGNAPSVGMRWRLGLKPTIPVSAAGMRTEPPVSVPIAISHDAVNDGDRGAGRRAARHALAVARIAGGAEMRIGADPGEGELGHVGLGDDHGARRAQTPHDRGIGGGRRRFFGEDFRAGPRRLAGDIEQILDGDDRAIERPERYADGGPRVGGVGRGPRRLGVNCQTDARALPVWLGDAEQSEFEAVAAGGWWHVRARG